MTHSDVLDCIHQEPGAPCKCGLWKFQDDENKLNRNLAAAQARERELRAALAKLSTWAVPGAIEHSGGEWRETVALVRAALSAPQDTTALREFGLKVATAMREAARKYGYLSKVDSVVDAVLKGTP